MDLFTHYIIIVRNWQSVFWQIVWQDFVNLQKIIALLKNMVYNIRQVK